MKKKNLLMAVGVGLIAVQVLGVTPLNSIINVEAADMRKVNGLNIPIECQYSNEEECLVLQAISKAGYSGADAAYILNDISNTTVFEHAVKDILDIYYKDDDKINEELDGFVGCIDNRAEEIVNNYREALMERRQSEKLDYEPGEIMVSFDAEMCDTDIKSIVKQIADGGEIITNMYEIDENLPEDRKQRICESMESVEEKVVLVNINKEQTTKEAIEEFEKVPGVIAATVNTKMELENVEINDAMASYLWHLDRVNVSDAWESIECANRSSSVKVAVIDTGIDLTHPDLKSNIDKSYSVDITGTSPVLLSSMSQPYVSQHGTEVAGVIAANVNNGIGVAGIAGITSEKNNYGCKVISIQAYTLHEDGEYKITMSNAIKAINYAVSCGADVINMSFATYVYNAGLETTINSAYNSGALLVASAGNQNVNSAIYPSDYEHVISVIATDPDDEKAYFSNYGVNKDISAPGFSIYTTKLGNDYDAGYGTSFSAPIVSATAAMMKSVNDNLTADEIEGIMKATATDIGAEGVDEMTAYGLLNTGMSVQKAKYRTFSDVLPVIKGITSIGTGIIRFNFDTIGNEERYNVYRSTSYSGTYENVKSIKVNQAGNIVFTDENLISGQTYYYKIWCKSKYSTTYLHGPFSNIVSCRAS